MAQVLKVKASRKSKRNAVRKFKALCHYYNVHSKMIDIVKEMLQRNMWTPGDAISHKETIDSLNSLAECALTVHLDFSNSIDKLQGLLKEIDNVKAQGDVFIHPVDIMRISEMRNLEFYLTELEKEIANILHEVTAILNEIEKIESFH